MDSVTNLHGFKKTTAPNSFDSKLPTHLTRQGIWSLNDIPSKTDVKDQNLVVQVTKVQILDLDNKGAETKKQ